MVGASRRGRDNPGSTPGVDIILHSLLEWSKGVDSTSTSTGSNPTVVVLLLRCGHGEIRPVPLAQTTPACLETVWPSGLRCWLQVPVREGVGSNPTGVIRVGFALVFVGFALVFPPPATLFRCLFPARVSHDCLAGLAQGASPQGHGFEPHRCRSLGFVFAFGGLIPPSEVDDPGRDSNLQSPAPRADASPIGPWGLVLATDALWASNLLRPGLGGAAPATKVPRCWRALGEASLTLDGRSLGLKGVRGPSPARCGTHGARRSGSTFDSRSEVWEFESLCPRCLLATCHFLLCRLPSLLPRKPRASVPEIAQLTEHSTVDSRSDQMVPGSTPGGRV